MKKQILLLLICAISSFLIAQNHCVSDTFCFDDDEQMSFHVYYNLGYLWIEAGDAEFSVSNITIKNTDCYHFKCIAKSFEKYNWLYKVQDTFEVCSQKSNLEPFYYRSHSIENKSNSISCYQFLAQNNQVHITQSEKDFTKDTTIGNLPECTFDPLTLTYALRSTDFSDLQASDTLWQNLIFNGDLLKLPIVYHGNREIEDRNGKNWDCILFSVVIGEGSIFLRNEEILVYVSRDKHRFPILVEAKIFVGSIKIYLSDI